MASGFLYFGRDPTLTNIDNNDLALKYLAFSMPVMTLLSILVFGKEISHLRTCRFDLFFAYLLI